MKVEFLCNGSLNDRFQLFIQESEFKKAKNSAEEFDSFAFATNCMFAFYGDPESYINKEEYEIILSNLEKGGAVIITMVREGYSRFVNTEVFVSNNNKIKRVL